MAASAARPTRRATQQTAQKGSEAAPIRQEYAAFQAGYPRKPVRSDGETTNLPGLSANQNVLDRWVYTMDGAA